MSVGDSLCEVLGWLFFEDDGCGKVAVCMLT